MLLLVLVLLSASEEFDFELKWIACGFTFSLFSFLSSLLVLTYLQTFSLVFLPEFGTLRELSTFTGSSCKDSAVVILSFDTVLLSTCSV